MTTRSPCRRAADVGGEGPDQTTRDLLAQRAVDDDHAEPRAAALQALAERWPDQATREFLAQRALEAPNMSERGAVFCLMGNMQSKFGRVLPTLDLDGIGPYLDPLEAIHASTSSGQPRRPELSRRTSMRRSPRSRLPWGGTSRSERREGQ